MQLAVRLRAVGRIRAREDLKVGQAFEMADNAEVFCPSFKSDEELDSYLRSIAPPRELVCPITQEVLKDPDKATLPGQEGQRSMWVLYGDPRWQDPLMVHRWAYTPRSLGLVMHQAGLADLKQEPAQFKLREPRDMRITGIKTDATPAQ